MSSKRLLALRRQFKPAAISAIWASFGILVAVALTTWEKSPTESWFKRLNDFGMGKSHSPSPEVVFVDIDRAAEQRFGRWPWSRSQFAEILEVFADADTTALDIMFTAPTTPDADEALVMALAMALVEERRFIGSFTARPDIAEPTSEDIIIDLLLHSHLRQLDLTAADFIKVSAIDHDLPIIMEVVRYYGAINALVDKDKILRQYAIAFDVQGIGLPSLGVQLLRMHLGIPLHFDFSDARAGAARIGNRSIPVDRHGKARLNFYPIESYPRIPLVDLWDGTVDPQAALAGKLVILGVSEAGVTDMINTPIGIIPGPLVHATFVSNFLQQHFLRDSRRTEIFGLIAILLFATAISRIPSFYLRQALALLGLILLVAVRQICLQQYLLFLDLAQLSFAFVFAIAAAESTSVRNNEKIRQRADRVLGRRESHQCNSFDGAVIHYGWSTAPWQQNGVECLSKAIQSAHERIQIAVASPKARFTDIQANGCLILFGQDTPLRAKSVLRTLTDLLQTLLNQHPEDSVLPPPRAEQPVCSLALGKIHITEAGATGQPVEQAMALTHLAQLLGPDICLAPNSPEMRQLLSGNTDLLNRPLPVPAPFANRIGTQSVLQIMPANPRNQLLANLFVQPLVATNNNNNNTDNAADNASNHTADDLNATLLKANQLYRDPVATNLLRLFTKMP